MYLVYISFHIGGTAPEYNRSNMKRANADVKCAALALTSEALYAAHEEDIKRNVEKEFKSYSTSDTSPLGLKCDKSYKKIQKISKILKDAKDLIYVDIENNSQRTKTKLNLSGRLNTLSIFLPFQHLNEICRYKMPSSCS